MTASSDSAPGDQERRRAQGESAPGAVRKRAHLTVTPEQILGGELCSCEACVRDGQHEPDCRVHDEPRGGCSCSRQEQSEGAG